MPLWCQLITDMVPTKIFLMLGQKQSFKKMPVGNPGEQKPPEEGEERGDYPPDFFKSK